MARFLTGIPLDNDEDPEWWLQRSLCVDAHAVRPSKLFLSPMMRTQSGSYSLSTPSQLFLSPLSRPLPPSSLLRLSQLHT